MSRTYDRQLTMYSYEVKQTDMPNSQSKEVHAPISRRIIVVGINVCLASDEYLDSVYTVPLHLKWSGTQASNVTTLRPLSCLKRANSSIDHVRD